MANEELKIYAKNKGVYLWQLAELFRMNDGNFSRKLRKELTEEEKRKCINYIDGYKQEAKNNEQTTQN